MADQEAKAKKIFWDLTTLQKINPSNGEEQDHNNWMMAMEGNDDNVCDSTSSAESSMENSTNSAASFSSSTDLTEDASSSPSSTLTSPANNGPLYQLSELMAQLPIKRGLSKFYHGKSQSYTSLASVKSLEDLAKKVTNTPYRSKMKSCKSYAGVLDGHSKKSYSPKAIISKKGSNSRGSLLSSLDSSAGSRKINPPNAPPHSPHAAY